MGPLTSDPDRSVTTPALLLIPDINGFTQFVRATKVAHSRQIIEELLEKLIDANEIGLQVSEIEGDAILFYRLGPPPTADEFFQQVLKMFLAFHGHLRLYERQRICPCSACAAAQALTLKVVAHYGDIAQSRVKDHVKLFGQDVIAVHRLLKNDIAHDEYALFTRALTKGWPSPVAPAWAPREEGAQDYDVGRMSYGYVPLAPLRQIVPEPCAEDFGIPGAMVKVFSFEQQIQAPMDLVFGAATDLPARLQWMAGTKDVEMLNHRFNRVGTKHRCVVGKNSPVMVTSGKQHTADTIGFSETDEDKTMCAVFTLRRESYAQTRVRIDGFLRDDIVPRPLFAMLLKRKVTNQFRASSEKLKHYCEGLHAA